MSHLASLVGAPLLSASPAVMATEGREEPGTPQRSGAGPEADPDTPTRDQVGEDWWDPPCRVCKRVDDEANVLCELCNGAYHLKCIETFKQALPRSPEDDEWFCRACVKRGVPERIVDRVGREAKAFYLVKWLGRSSAEVSWEDATTLDTAWSRKIIREYLTTIEPARKPIAPLLPPCHPLVDTRSAPSASGVTDVLAAATRTVMAEPAAETQEAGVQLLACLRAFCSPVRLPSLHLLEPLAVELVRVLRTQAHTRCVSFAPWLANVDPAAQTACAAVERAAAAVAGAASAVDASWWHAVSSQGQAAAPSRGSGRKRTKSVRGAEWDEDAPASNGAPAWMPPSAASDPLAADAALETAPTRALLGRLAALAARSPPPAHLLAPVACAAARLLLSLEHPEWDAPPAAWIDAADRATRAFKALRASFDELLGAPPVSASTAVTNSAAAAAATPNTYRSFLLYLKEHRERLRAAQPDATPREIERLAAIEVSQLSAYDRTALGERSLQLHRSSMGAVPPALAGLMRRGGGTGGGGGGSGTRGESRKRRPCFVCHEYDRRDALVCQLCYARVHLMCMWPPRENVPEEAWTCDDCRSAVPPLRHVPAPGDELEAEVQESDEKGGAVTWKRAVVLRKAGPERFVLMINPDEEDDFIEEYGMEDEGKEWRRPAAAVQAHALKRAAAEEAAAAVVKERATRAAAVVRDTVATSSDASTMKLVEELYRDGVTVLANCITSAQVEAAEEVVERGYRHYMHTVKTLDLQERLNDVGFYEIKIRNAGRYDLQLPELSSPDFSYLTSKAPWLPLVHAALGADAVCAHFGCMLSFPGSAMQPWHADGPHIRGSGEESELAPIAAPADGDAGEGAADEGSATDAGRAAPFVAPVHALNVFVPLVDLTADKGPTEFVPGTQFDFDLKVASKVITVDAGSAILFDYRVKHRGLGNRSNVDRPLLYITYARPFWLDIHNFDRKRYTSLPQVEDRGSRDERMQKRARES